MTYLRLLTVMLCLLVPLQARAGQPINDLLDVRVPAKLDGSAYSVEEVRRAIIAGTQRRGWTPRLEGGSKIIASILVRSKHYAEVEIAFTATSYSITYRDSRELDYDKDSREIHRNYNKWVSNLSESIQKEFGLQ